MKFAVTALMFGMFLANIHDGKPKALSTQAPVKLYSQSYFEKLDEANAALQVYYNTSCTAPEFSKSSQTFVVAAKQLENAYKNIPDNEDKIVETHEIEAFLGFVELSTRAVSKQDECIKSNYTDNGTSKG